MLFHLRGDSLSIRKTISVVTILIALLLLDFGDRVMVYFSPFNRKHNETFPKASKLQLLIL